MSNVISAADIGLPIKTRADLALEEPFLIQTTVCDGFGRVSLIGNMLHLIGYIEQPSIGTRSETEHVVCCRIALPIEAVAAALPMIAMHLPTAVSERVLPGFKPDIQRLHAAEVQGHS